MRIVRSRRRRDCGCRAGVLIAASCGAGGDGGGFFRQYEYEEEMYLSLDGTATVYVNSSLPALNALRGTAFDDDARTRRIDREAVRAFFTTPDARASTARRAVAAQRPPLRPRPARRRRRAPAGRGGAVRVVDVRASSATAICSSTARRSAHAAGKDAGDAGWTRTGARGVPAAPAEQIRYHNTGRRIGRGNILVWEQPLAERLRGAPLDARRADGAAVDSLSHALAVRLDVRGGRRRVRAGDLVGHASGEMDG